MEVTQVGDARGGMVFVCNNEVADRCALSLEQECVAEYSVAKRDYKLARERFHCTTAATRARPVLTADQLHDISTYTSSLDPAMLRYYDACPRVPDTRAVDRELRARAEQRRAHDLQQMELSGAMPEMSSYQPHNPHSLLCAVLTQRANDEYGDIAELEQAEFRVLAKKYYDSIFGAVDYLLFVEEQARKTIEDFEASSAIQLLARLRDNIFVLEKSLLARGLGGTRLLAYGRRRQDELDKIDAKTLDVMYAVPLWQRVCAIRQETLNEEEVNFCKLHLAHITQRDLVAKGYLRVNTQTRLIERIPGAAVPHYKEEDVAAAFASEHLCLALQEESARMRIVDAAVQEEAEVYAAHKSTA